MENKKTLYFMAGLPRAGSTMLSAILNQNPRFYSGPSSPVVGGMLSLEQNFNQDELYFAYPKKQQVEDYIKNLIYYYYSDVKQPVVFDKNRSWTNRPAFIESYFGIEPKILCPVRSILDILTSFIDMHRRNPYQIGGKLNFLDDMLVKTGQPLTDENRCDTLCSPMGIVGQSAQGIREMLMSNREKQLHLIEYDDLVNDPETTMKKVYDYLGEEYYKKHDFKNLVNLHQENDAGVYGFADMHQVRKELKKVSKKPSELLPESIVTKYKNQEFWRNLETDAKVK